MVKTAVDMIKVCLDYLLKSFREFILDEIFKIPGCRLILVGRGVSKKKKSLPRGEYMVMCKRLFLGVWTMKRAYACLPLRHLRSFTWETIINLLFNIFTSGRGFWVDFRNMTSTFDELMKFIKPMFEGSFKGVFDSVTLETISKLVGLLSAHLVDAVFGTSGKMISAIDNNDSRKTNV
ncbi:hypothetical protein Tco_1209806 [Tanacetum coccineum]